MQSTLFLRKIKKWREFQKKQYTGWHFTNNKGQKKSFLNYTEDWVDWLKFLLFWQLQQIHSQFPPCVQDHEGFQVLSIDLSINQINHYLMNCITWGYLKQ